MKSFKTNPLVPLVLLGCASCIAPVGAQTVYRCGSSYSQTPCAGAAEVQVDDARTDVQRAAAREGLARDKALGKEMETSRRQDEAQVLAREKALQAAHAKQLAHDKALAAKAEARKRSEEKKAHDKGSKHEVFTVTVGNGKKAAKSR
jgi:hypothetical protein